MPLAQTQDGVDALRQGSGSSRLETVSGKSLRFDL
jgi:hypothetical protein